MTTSVSRGLHILCIKFKVKTQLSSLQQRVLHINMWGLAFYSIWRTLA